MRLDKFLKLSRIIKRRTIAKDVADLGFVLINDKTAKPSSEIKVGDELKLNLGERRLTLKVTQISLHPSKKESSQMFEIINDEVIDLAS